MEFPENSSHDAIPTLIVEHTSRWQSFTENFRDALSSPKQPASQAASSSPGQFWSDVFVNRPLPWWHFVVSISCHLFAIALLLVLSRLIAVQPHAVSGLKFDESQVIYYQAADLPPLDTRRKAPQRSNSKADRGLARQAIISVPPESDNRSQTVVTPPNVRIRHRVRMPNMVEWTGQPQLPISPPPLIPASKIARITPRVESAVIAPPPQASFTEKARLVEAVETSIVAPPPEMETASARPIGSLDFGPSAIVAPAPQLTLPEQRAIPRSLRSGARARVIAPPPAVSSGYSGGRNRIIALNLHPTMATPASLPAGNRRGSFAATPEGKVSASGAPGSSHGDGHEVANGSEGTSGKSGSVPAGLYVASAVNPRLLASVSLPRVAGSRKPLTLDNESRLPEAERAVFSGRKFYALRLSMPNLNSGGGSWVIRFAELDKTASGENLSAPYATRQVDPAYPLQLMQQNIGGTEILYAVIHADGSVGQIKVLRSVDGRLDRFASQAVSQWTFQPAMENGKPVDVEATFEIPFRPAVTGSNF